MKDEPLPVPRLAKPVSVGVTAAAEEAEEAEAAAAAAAKAAADEQAPGTDGAAAATAAADEQAAATAAATATDGTGAGTADENPAPSSPVQARTTPIGGADAATPIRTPYSLAAGAASQLVLCDHPTMDAVSGVDSEAGDGDGFEEGAFEDALGYEIDAASAEVTQRKG